MCTEIIKDQYKVEKLYEIKKFDYLLNNYLKQKIGKSKNAFLNNKKIILKNDFLKYFINEDNY